MDLNDAGKAEPDGSAGSFQTQRNALDPHHNTPITSRFQRDVFPEIGKRHIAHIESPDILRLRVPALAAG